MYERRLIEAYIGENGVEPATGEPLTVEDLIPLKTPSAVRPRPPTLTSIPSLLGVFQEEWDALALETHTLRQNLAQTRQDLSNALYQHDAAVRLIARLSKERDDAREALAKVNVGAPTNGDAMHVDSRPLSAKIISRIQTTQETLSATRRKRPVPEDWATADTIAAYTPKIKKQSQFSGGSALAIHSAGDLALIGGSDGGVDVYSTATDGIVSTFSAGSGSVTSALWVGQRAVTATSKGQVVVTDAISGTKLATSSVHAGSVSALALHPSGDLYASTGDDGSYVIYDAVSMDDVTQVQTGSGMFSESSTCILTNVSALTCAQFHPDGHLLAVGNREGTIKIYDVKTGTQAAIFEFGSSIKGLVFSENGIWIAVVAQDSSTLSIWDIRKQAEIKSLDVGGVVESVDWDYTGQFLVAGSDDGVVVNQYLKSSKSWNQTVKAAIPARSIAWGHAARSIVAVDAGGLVTVLA